MFSVESNCTNIIDHPTIHVIPSLPMARMRLLAPVSIKSSVVTSGAKHRDSVVSIIESSNMLEMIDGERYVRSHDQWDHIMWDHMIWGPGDNIQINWLHW